MAAIAWPVAGGSLVVGGALALATAPGATHPRARRAWGAALVAAGVLMVAYWALFVLGTGSGRELHHVP